MGGQAWGLYGHRRGLCPRAEEGHWLSSTNTELRPQLCPFPGWSLRGCPEPHFPIGNTARIPYGGPRRGDNGLQLCRGGGAIWLKPLSIWENLKRSQC